MIDAAKIQSPAACIDQINRDRAIYVTHPTNERLSETESREDVEPWDA